MHHSGLIGQKKAKLENATLFLDSAKSHNRPDPKLVQPLFEIKYHCLPKCTGLFLMTPAQFSIGRKQATDLSISTPRWRPSWSSSNGWLGAVFNRPGSVIQYEFMEWLCICMCDRHHFRDDSYNCSETSQTPITEAQKPKTFRIAASYAQKLSRRSAQNRFSRHA